MAILQMTLDGLMKLKNFTLAKAKLSVAIL